MHPCVCVRCRLMCSADLETKFSTCSPEPVVSGRAGLGVCARAVRREFPFFQEVVCGVSRVLAARAVFNRASGAVLCFGPVAVRACRPLLFLFGAEESGNKSHVGVCAARALPFSYSTTPPASRQVVRRWRGCVSRGARVPD